MEKFKEDKLVNPRKIRAFDREIELMRYKGFGLTPEQLTSFLRAVVEEDPEVDVKSKAKEMLNREEVAFAPDCSKDCIFSYSSLLGEYIKQQMDLYQVLGKKGHYYGGGEQQRCFHLQLFLGSWDVLPDASIVNHQHT